MPGGGQSVTGQYRHLTLNFASGLKSGQGLQFGIDRDLAISGYGGSNEGNAPTSSVARCSCRRARPTRTA